MTINTVVLYGITKSFTMKSWLMHKGKLGEVTAKTEALDFKEPAGDGRPWFSGTDSCIVAVRTSAKSSVRIGAQIRPVANMVLERIGES
jgi:hypothetical protein